MIKNRLTVEQAHVGKLPLAMYPSAMITFRRSLYCILLILTACNLSRAEATLQAPTATTLRLGSGSPVPTLDRDLHPVVSEQTEPPAVVSQNCQLAESLPTTQHIIAAGVDYAQRTVVVQQTIHYINRTGDELSDVVLNIEPNRWLGAFHLNSLTDDDRPASAELTGRRLTVTLPQPLKVGCTTNLKLSFRLDIPAVGHGLDAYHGYFGYSDRQLNLGHWLPSVATRRDHEWITQQEFFIGEQQVLDTADWDVTLTVINASDKLQIAAPGEVTQLKQNVWRYLYPNARDFAVSMSETFNKQTQQTPGGIRVEMYSFGDSQIKTDKGMVDAAAYALDMATKAIDTFSNLYGTYPYKRMVVVEGDFPDGMEFSSLVFVGGAWFRSYEGNPAAYLTIIPVHEVAHQWWYARVGNDQALHPWLDEALATYSEYVFIEQFYPELKDWWWNFRVNRLAPEGFIDSSVYEFSSLRLYINAVYLRGVEMLRDLRADIGTEAFFDLLRRYAEVGKGHVVTPDVFWSLLTPEQLAKTTITRAKYFRQPDALVKKGN
jgi:hypothetical protein